jgi:hypothetical protein
VLVAQLDPSLAPGAERQHDGPELAAGVCERVPNTGPLALGVVVMIPTLVRWRRRWVSSVCDRPGAPARISP